MFIFLEEVKMTSLTYYEAAKHFKGNTIVRVCADNPFVDSEQINLLVNKFKKTI